MSAIEDSRIAEALQQLCGQGEARRVFEALAARKRPAAETAVEALIKPTRLDRSTISAVFKQIAQTGAGEFKYGRHGNVTRIEWWYSADSVGNAGLGRGDLEPLFTDVESAEEVEADDDSTEIVTHTIQLRPHFSVDIGLPRDLTSKEADRLAGMIRLLAFDD